MKKSICACIVGLIVFMACNKKGPDAAAKVGEATIKVAPPECEKEIITEQPVKAGETGIVLPVGTKLCFTPGSLEIRVTLPPGYTFITKGGTEKPLPVYGTYTCICSQMGSHCQVFYAEGLGFGCLQSSCTGSCTGKFTYAGYTVDRVVSSTDKETFFNYPEVQKEIASMHSDEPYSKHTVYGVSFFLVNDVARFMEAGAKCDCEGTQACTLKTITISGKKIYFCEGPCNGCELTV